MAKKTTITVESNSLMVLRARGSTRAWCPQCTAETEMVSLGSLGVVSNLDRAELQDWLNSGDLHRCETADGPAICLNSLLVRMGTANQPNAAKEEKR